MMRANEKPYQRREKNEIFHCRADNIRSAYCADHSKLDLRAQRIFKNFKFVNPHHRKRASIKSSRQNTCALAQKPRTAEP
jgi:hypothetical protein